MTDKLQRILNAAARVVSGRVCISGYPDNGYPDLSVNFTAAKNPDILK